MALNIKQVPAHVNNYEKGRRGKTVKWIICHWIVGNLSAADGVFTNPQKGTSAHYGIGQNEIHQYVNENDTAFHAGNFDVNLQSIGIEHEGGPNIPITDAVYKQSAELVASLCKKYSIPFDRVFIRKHSEIKATQCPGTLDIDKIIRMAKELSISPPVGTSPDISSLQKQIGELQEKLDDLDRQKKEWEQKYKILDFELQDTRVKYIALKTAIVEARKALNSVSI